MSERKTKCYYVLESRNFRNGAFSDWTIHRNENMKYKLDNKDDAIALLLETKCYHSKFNIYFEYRVRKVEETSEVIELSL